MPRSTTARNVNIQGIDSWSEVTLGLCSICVVTLILIPSSFALFEFGVVPWVKSWESPPGNTTTSTTTTTTTAMRTTSSSPEITLTWFKQQVKIHAGGGFNSIPKQKGHDGSISFQDFSGMTNDFTPPLNAEKEAWAFKFFDCNGDGAIEKSEYDAALEANEFYDGAVECPASTSIEATTTVTTTMAVFPKSELELIWSKINRDHLKIVRQDCNKMDLEGAQEKNKGDGTQRTEGIDLDEFLAYMQIRAKLDPKEANDLFRVVDLNDDSEVSRAECKLRLGKFVKMIEGLGSANTIVTDLDMDGDQVLNAKEFGHIGDMLYMGDADDSAIGARSTKVWYYRLNKDGDPGISADELNFTMPPTPAPPSGLGKATTNTYKAAPANEKALTPDELSKYEGIPAIVQGRTHMKLEVPLNIALPADAGMAQVLWRNLVKMSFDQVMGTQLKSISKDVYHKSEALLAQEGLAKTAETKHLTFSWEVDVPDGGDFQEKLVEKAPQIRKKLFTELTSTGIPWLTQAKVAVDHRITAEYYGMKALSLNKTTIIQNFGSENGKDMDGSAPYSLNSITNRRLGKANPRLLV